MSDRFKSPASVQEAEGASPPPQTHFPSAQSSSPGASDGIAGSFQEQAGLAEVAALSPTDAAGQSSGGDTLGNVQTLVSAASAVTGLAQAVKGGDVGGMLSGMTQAAGLMSPKAGQALGTATQALGAVKAFTGSASGNGSGLQAAGAPAEALQTLIPDEHPLGGQAIQDFISSAEFYAPPVSSPQAAGGTGAGTLEDKDRLLRLHAPLSGDKRLYVAALEGNASLSNPYCYRLQLLSHHAAIDLQDVLGKNFTVGIAQADGTEHPINGYVTGFGFSHTDGGLAVYTAEVTPWLWYLSKRITSRIFQDMSVLDVLDKVFRDYGALPDHTIRVNKRPAPDTYIVQYDESDLDFVGRLLERYGLFYYFEHRLGGHTLIISDDSTHSAFCPAQQAHAMVRYNAGDRVDSEDGLTALSAYRNFQPSLVALNTFKYTDPHAIQYVEQPTVAQQGDVPKLTVYHGNPAYTHKDRDAGNLDAQRLMEAYEWQAKLFMAQSECRGMVAGHTFQLNDHHWFESAGDANFLVVGIQINARNNLNLGDDTGKGGDVYENTLTLIRSKIPYRPVRHHAKPVMKGPQTATVVGPKGQEIYTDKYGRIKVQFPWDLEGKHNESSSCWIRVSQPWAGKGWGTLAIPRIGQEVIVDYIEGDPDRPVCTGRLFNGAQTMPMGMPDGAHTMGFISNSTPGGGGQCRMTIRDKAGEELIDLFSQKDMNITVLDTETHLVDKGNRSVTLKTGDEFKTLTKGALSENIAKMRSTEANTVQVKAVAKQNGPGTQLYESSDQIKHVVGDGSITMTKEKIILAFGPSSIVISASGIFLDGPVIHLNKDKG